MKKRRAWRRPIAATTYGEITAGTRPSLTSLSENFAASTPIAMSQQATRPTPPPYAEPFTRAMVGLERKFSVRINAASRSASSRFAASLADAMRRIQLRSAPAENEAPAPVSTTQRTLASSSQSSSAAVRSAISFSSNALCTCGRFSLISATEPLRATRMDSLMGEFFAVGSWDDSELGWGWVSRFVVFIWWACPRRHACCFFSCLLSAFGCLREDPTHVRVCFRTHPWRTSYFSLACPKRK